MLGYTVHRWLQPIAEIQRDFRRGLKFFVYLVLKKLYSFVYIGFCHETKKIQNRPVILPGVAWRSCYRGFWYEGLFVPNNTFCVRHLFLSCNYCTEDGANILHVKELEVSTSGPVHWAGQLVLRNDGLLPVFLLYIIRLTVLCTFANSDLIMRVERQFLLSPSTCLVNSIPFLIGKCMSILIYVWRPSSIQWPSTKR